MPHNMCDVKGAMAEYLSLPEWDWTWFVTQTFDDYKSKPYPKICEHSWRYFLRLIGEPADQAYGWMFSERGKSGRLHWHALVHVSVNSRKDPKARNVWDTMYHKYGRCQVLEYVAGDSRLTQDLRHCAVGVSHYLTKYVAKQSHGGDATWDFGGFIDGCEADSAQLSRAIGVRPASL